MILWCGGVLQFPVLFLLQLTASTIFTIAARFNTTTDKSNKGGSMAFSIRYNGRMQSFLVIDIEV